MTEQELKEKYGKEMGVVDFAGKIPVSIFSFRKDKHDFEKGWETEYLRELINTLKEGMIVFDIGAEQGEFTAMAAKIVGGSNVHIFEPSKDYWYNIKSVWDANKLEYPGGLFGGYVCDETTSMVEDEFKSSWGNDGEVFYGTNQVSPKQTPRYSITIDDYCLLNPFPDVIMMDIEGAELSAVRGALKVIKEKSPIFFISIHSNELINERSGGIKEDIHKLFSENGYVGIHIKTDHEEHWKFVKQ